MNKREFIFKQRALASANRKYSEHLVEISVDLLQLQIKQPGMAKYPQRAWRSNRFVVLEFAEAEGISRLSINRTAIDRNGDWLDGITWDELQLLKQQCGYGDLDAVEVFPADKDVQFVANMRHLFVFQKPLDFVWRRK